MGAGISIYIRRQVMQETQRRVASAAKRGGALSIPTSAAEITEEFPGSALPDEDVRNQLFAEAGRAGVATELGQGPADGR